MHGTKLEYTLKHNLFLQKLYVFFGSLFFRFLGIFVRPKMNNILFQSMIGRTFEDSPKVLYEAILRDDFFKNYSFFWAFLDPKKFNIEKGKTIKINSLKYFITALKCGVWIGNSGIERGLHFKHKKTIFINTGHGAAVKYIGNAVKGRKDFNFSDVDLFCTVSQMDKEVRIRDMNVKEEALQMIGYPVNDYLYHIDKTEIEKLKEKYNIPKNKKVICYAPTWRESQDNGKTSVLAPPLNIQKWRKELSDDYVIIFRAHHLTTNVLGICFDDFVLDGSSKYPSYEILAISDILISDYSSILFDFAILERPLFAFIYDYEQYSKERGLYISPLDFIPETSFMNEDDLLSGIKTIDVDKQIEVARQVKEKYMVGNGEATNLCIRFLKDRLLK